MSNDKDDLIFFSVTEEDKVVLRQLSESLFNTEAAAFKACVALALAEGIPPLDVVKGSTTWNVATMSDLLDFVRWHQSTETPVRLCNSLGHAGIAHVRKQLASGLEAAEIIFKAK
jgi:hypothetical protein